MGETAAIVLTGGDHAGGERETVGGDVGLVAELDVAVGVQAAQGQWSARAVVLERARQHVDTVRQQRGGQSIALEALVGGTLEAEGEGPVAAQPHAPGLGQSGAAHRNVFRSGKSSDASKVRSIASVAVSRSPMNQ